MAHKQPCAKYQYIVTPTGGKIVPVDEPSCKDEESPADYNVGGYLPVKVGDTFKHGRYRVIRKLGWGHFSTVWLVKDIHAHRHSALKVVKSAGRYAETARDEIKLLTHVSSFSPTHPGREHVVSFFDSFTHQGPESAHVCIVFEPLGENLLGLISRNKKGVPRSLVKVIARQILLGLQYLHDECDLVHTDIKPENILISIPDIEAHIQGELASSQSPTSRRVGIPYPTKSRAGVTIPYNPHRPRRQVQIFDSQPLSSPGKSLGRSIGRAIAPINGPQAGTNSGSNSLAGSYITSVHTKVAGSATTGFSGPSVPATVLSSAPKLSSTLAVSSQCAPEVILRLERKPIPEPQASAATNSATNVSPTTSSSSSSVASTTIESSSMVSTPPTSLSNSIGNVVAGFIGLAKVVTEVNARLADSSDHDSVVDNHWSGLQVRESKGKERAVEQVVSQTTASSSWKMTFGLSSSWKEKMSSSLSTFRSSASADTKQQLTARPDHSNLRSSSGMSSSGFWKDLGTAAPAPAVVVSAIANADGQVYRYNLSASPSVHSRVCASDPASFKSTPARPSPLRTPYSPITETHSDTNHPPSLLAQTAPTLKRVGLRASPIRHISQLSAHIHTNKPSSNRCSNSHNYYPRTTKSRTATRVLPSQVPSQSVSTTSASVTPTPNVASPSAPPPTPITSPTPTPFIPMYINDLDRASAEGPACIVPPIAVKIADLGNATPSTKHFTEDIQTRQYRAPEAIMGRKDWDGRADMWSLACVIFELLTAEYLFDPQGQGELFSKDDDHMAQIIELMGDVPLEIKMGGKFSRELFDHTGALRYIRTLKPWPLKCVMSEKYSWAETESNELCAFLEPMLVVDMRERKRARDMIDHSWLSPTEADGVVTEW